MGSQASDATRRARAHDVVVLPPAGGTARSCALSFTRYGAEFTAAGTEVLRVPWWAISGFSPEVAEEPSACRLEMVTDAGVLGVLVAAEALGDVLDDLATRARRWRLLRLPAVRAATRAAAMARPAVSQLPGLARLLVAELARHARSGAWRRPVWRPALAALSIVGLSVSLVAALGSAPPRPPGTGAVTVASVETATQAAASGWWGIGETMRQARLDGIALRLAKASAPPPPAPPSVASEPPLSPHEVFGFAPYWALGQQSAIQVSGFTTLAYFAVTANSDGTLQQSGPGWDGFESQDFADLVARAHAAGDRVVLTVECFTQPQLTSLTTSPQAASTLATQVLQAVSSKNLDGVNIDLEGNGNRAGLTSLVATVSDVLHGANPHYQVTVDTDASSAADPQGFYDVQGLARVADGLFVMAYGLNVASGPTAASPITSNQYSDALAASQYAAAVPGSKVIFGLPYFGYVWPTNDGTMAAVATGTGAGISDATAVAAGHPVYWDPVTDSAWTSYEIGSQWYEAYFTDPASIYAMTELSDRSGFAGVGAWALGMDGDSAQMTAALDGNAPAERAGPAGPASTSMSSPAPHPAAPKTTPKAPAPAPVSIPSLPPPPTTSTTVPSKGSTTTTTSTTAPATTGTSAAGGNQGSTPGLPAGGTTKARQTPPPTPPTGT